MAGYDCKFINSGVDVPIKLDTTRPGGIGAALTRQDVTPSNVAFKANLPGWDEMQPYSERTYEWLGGLGLREQTDAPGDNNRHWIGDLTTYRARQVHAPLRYKTGTVATSGITLLANTLYATTETKDGPGLVVSDSGAIFRYCRWNGTSFAHQRAVQSPAVNIVPSYVTAAPYSNAQIPVTVEHNGKLWMAANGANGMFDANTAFPQTLNVGASNGLYCVGTQLLGDINFLFSFHNAAASRPGLTITAVDESMAAITRDAELGAATITIKVANVGHFLGSCTVEGSIYFTSDRQFYQAVYDENYQRLLVSSLLNNPDGAITSAPVNYNGLVYFGCGARVAQYTPGDRRPQYLPVDASNTVPPPFDGVITHLYPTTDALYATIVERVATTWRWALLRMDPNGAWSTVYADLAVGFAVGKSPLVRIANTAVGSAVTAAIGFPAKSPAVDFKVVPVFDATQNPVNMAAADRAQEGGKHYLIEPSEYGEVRASQKYALKFLLEVADVTASLPIKIWYQVNEDEYKANNYVVAGTPSAIPSGLVLSGRGQWTLGATLDNTTTGLSSVDGTAYAGFAKFSLAGLSYPSFKRLTLAIEITGDTTGTYLPRCRGLKHRYLEVPAKYYLWTLRCRLDVKDGQLGTLARQTAATLGTDYDTILALCSAGTIVDFVDPKGGTRKVQLTKNVEAWREKDDGGLDPTTLPLVGTTTMTKFLLTISAQEIEEVAA